MDRRKRLRRVALLCCHFTRNLAYYRAGWRNGEQVFSTEFWATTNANYLDIAVLEWCKLLGDKKDKHYWANIVSDQTAFESGLLSKLKTTDAEFNEYRDTVRVYRDKFIAHLDSELVMTPPEMTIAKEAVHYYHEYLKAHEDEANFLQGLPDNMAAYYTSCNREAKARYQ